MLQTRTRKRMMLEGEVRPGWHVVRAIRLSKETAADGTFILSDDIFDRYGAGDTLDEAKAAYIADLIGYFDIMEQHADKANARNQRIMELLHQYISKSDE
jgi:hypothetical protein